MAHYIPSNLHKAIRSHSVFIFNPTTKDFGSGVLVVLEKRIFVFSARHILDGDIDISFGIIPHQTPFTILGKWIHPTLDIGYIELKSSEAYLRMGELTVPFMIGGKRRGAMPTMNPTFAICGFPRQSMKDTDQGRQIEVYYMTVALLPHKKWPDAFAHFNVDDTFLIIYGEKRGGTIRDAEGNPVTPMHPRGMSGSALWYVDPGTEHSDRPSYSLLGILRGYDDFYKVLIANSINPLVSALADQTGVEFPEG